MSRPQDPKDIRTKLSFYDDAADLSLAYVIEIMMTLQAYKEGLSIVGGWAPYFLLEQYKQEGNQFLHVGSIDIDIAVNPEVIDGTQYARLAELLEGRGYAQRQESPYTYRKVVTTNDNRELIIDIDFLAPEEGGTSPRHRNQRVQNDFLARKARGAELAFEHKFDFTLSGKLPNGADATVSFYVADIVAMMAMKSYVLGNRYKEKDAYDIYSMVLHYKDGVSSVAEELKPFITQDPFPEGVATLKTYFESETAAGASFVADFYGETGDERAARMQEAYLQIQRLLELLEV